MIEKLWAMDPIKFEHLVADVFGRGVWETEV